MSIPLELPTWVRTCDGRLAPFDADKICQTLFAATEKLHRPDAFLAREMTESVMHFMAHEFGRTSPSTAQIAELLGKVLRELGQADLAHALEMRSEAPEESIERTANFDDYLDECRRRYSVQAVFSRDLVAAQDEGWLTLVGLHHPAELEGGVVDWPSGDDRSLLVAMLAAGRRFGGFLAVDGPEYALRGPNELPGFIRDLQDGRLATGLPMIVNLNAAAVPVWARPAGDGPLFGGAAANVDSRALALAIFDAVAEKGVRIDWHLGERDLISNLRPVLRRALAGAPVRFVLDRPPAPAALAEGLDRQHPLVLQTVGLHLGPLLDKPGIDGRAEPLLQNLLHVARMAVSAAVQKRQYLRRARHGDLQRGFVLDRARLHVIPVGLPAVVERLTGQTMASGKPGLAMARQILERLADCLREAGRMANVEAVLDSPWWSERQPGTGPLLVSPHLVGLTCADFSTPAQEQLRAAGALHKIAGAGTVTLPAIRGQALDVEQLAGLLEFALHKTDIIRLRLRVSV